MLVFRNHECRTLVATLIILLGVVNLAEAKVWRGIKPLRSTRADVERVLGKPRTNRIDWAAYDFETEEVSIEYSKGPCSVEFSPWNVPLGTVLSVWVTPKLDLKASDLDFNSRNFRKTLDSHVASIVHYLDEADGVEYEVNETHGTVVLIKYQPSAADKMMRCPEPANRLSEVKLDEFYDTSLRATKGHLNRFARQLRKYTSINYASAEGHILAYAGRSGSDNAKARADRAKEYLVRVWHIDPRRIETRDAGRRRRPTIVLYLVPPGGDPPLSRSIVQP